MAVDSRVVPHASIGVISSVRNTIDFSANPVASASDVVKLFNLYPGMKVLDIRTKVLTAEGEAATADIGDYGSNNVAIDADGIHNDVDLNATAGTYAFGGGAYAIVGGKGITATGSYIGLLATVALNAAKIEFEMFYIE